MKYRGEIDGLRALAIIPVILFHAGFDFFSGGFIGVDVFFVISGYLITSIVIEDIENKRFNIMYFYERRMRRILPALIIVMLVCIPFAWVWMLPSQMKDFSQSIVATSIFVSNIFFWKTSGYFDPSSEEKPLIHTWSLAVEEQYYFLFPIFLIITWRYGKNRIFWMIVLMTSISLLLSEWGLRNKPIANFYLLPTRAWELLMGSIAAFIIMKNGVKKNNILAFFGLSLIVISMLIYEEKIPFPSIYALAPVIGVFLIILNADNETWVGKILSTKVLTGIGLISYSAYLWHQPLFVFGKIQQGGSTTNIFMLSLSLISFFLAYFSWKYIENIFRDREKIHKNKFFLIIFIGIILTFFLGIIGNYKAHELRSGQFNPYHKLMNLKLGEYIADNRFLQKESWKILRNLAKDDNYGVLNNPFDEKLWYDLSSSNERILVVGNSHSKDIYNILSQSSWFLDNYQIARFGEQIRNLLPSHRFWDSENYKAANHILIASKYEYEDFEILPVIIDRIISDGKNISFVKNINNFPGEATGFSLIDKIILKNTRLEPEKIALIINSEYYNYYKKPNQNSEVVKKNTKINMLLKDIANKKNIIVLDRMDYICNDAEELCYAVEKNLSKNFYDYGHHTLEGSRYFAKSKLIIKFLDPLNSKKK